MTVTETKYATIVVSATHGKLGVVRNAQITSNTINTIKVQFDFKTSDWDNLVKTAVFWKEEDMLSQDTDKKIIVVLDENDECNIPPEMVLEREETFFVGIYGTGTAGTNKRIVSNFIPFHITQGCYGGGSTSQTPTQDVYEQLLEKLTYSAGTNVEIANNVISVVIPDNIATKSYVDSNSGKIDKINVNGVEQSIVNKVVNINVPTKTSELENDSNYTTYAYLVNTIVGDDTASPITIDDGGYGARYSLCFATTPLSDENGIVVDERWSSLVKSSSSGTSKVATTPKSGKFYIDRHPFYIYSANVAAGAMPVSSVYQNYTGADLRYSVNTSSTYLTRSKKVFLWLKNFNEEDMSFEADNTIGNIMSIDKISIRFPTTITEDVYLYFLGWNTATWYSLSPNFTQCQNIYKYTPNTKKFSLVNLWNSELQNALLELNTAITRL